MQKAICNGSDGCTDLKQASELAHFARPTVAVTRVLIVVCIVAAVEIARRTSCRRRYRTVDIHDRSLGAPRHPVEAVQRSKQLFSAAGRMQYHVAAHVSAGYNDRNADIPGHVRTGRRRHRFRSSRSSFGQGRFESSQTLYHL